MSAANVPCMSRIVLSVVAAAMFALVSCSSDQPVEVPNSIVGFEGRSTSDAPAPPATPAPTPTLVDPAGFLYESGGTSGYYFTTPSGLWRCAILADSAQGGSDNQMAGCQPKTSKDMPVEAAPLVEQFGSGALGAPNAILVNRSDDARFASLSQALFWRMDETTPVLGYGQTLSANGFSCNVQESGVSCGSDSSGRGFQFSTGGYRFEYVEALGAPTAAAPSVSAEPVLGRVWGPDQKGYGEVRPADIYNGGSLSGLVENIVWQDWGGAQATGTGVARNVDQSSGVANAPIEPVTIVGFDLGDCERTFMYRSVVWFFPDNGETFESAKDMSTKPCEENAYTDPNSGSSGRGTCGVVTAADGIPRDVLVSKGSVSCPEAMTVMNATYLTLYDKPLEIMEYAEWYCSINPAGEILFSCGDGNQEASSLVVIYRSMDDPYR